MPRKRTRVECVECRRWEVHHGRGLCSTCHKRASAEGRLTDYPPSQSQIDKMPAADRYEDYVFLISTGRARTTREAAVIMGVAHKTLEKALTRHRARMRLTNVEQLTTV